MICPDCGRDYVHTIQDCTKAPTIEDQLAEAWREWHDEMFYKNLKLCVDGAGLPEYLNLNPRK